jgi:radical SAM-linked protein
VTSGEAGESRHGDSGPLRALAATKPDGPDIRIRFRVRYTRREDVRLASHLDLTRCFQRGLRRAGVPVAYSRGFSPHPRLSFGPPLPLGVLGECEYLDIMFSRPPQAGWIDRLNACLPAGLKVCEARMIDLHGTSLAALVNAARYSVEIWNLTVDAKTLSGMIEDAFGGEKRILDMSITVGDDNLAMDLKARMVAGQPRPEKVLEKVLREFEACYTITRKELYIERRGDLRSPFFPDKQEVTPD